MNIGNLIEHTVGELSGSFNKLAYKLIPEDDSKQRCSNITHVQEVLSWELPASTEKSPSFTLRWLTEREIPQEIGRTSK